MKIVSILGVHSSGISTVRCKSVVTPPSSEPVASPPTHFRLCATVQKQRASNRTAQAHPPIFVPFVSFCSNGSMNQNQTQTNAQGTARSTLDQPSPARPAVPPYLRSPTEIQSRRHQSSDRKFICEASARWLSNFRKNIVRCWIVAPCCSTANRCSSVP